MDGHQDNTKLHDLTVFREIYTPEVIEPISTRAAFDKGFGLLYKMLTGADEHLAIDRIHFGKCLRFAKEHNGLDGDRRRRLCNPDDYAAWRAARNELLVPYFLPKRFHLHVVFTVNPSAKGQGDFQIIHRQDKVIVEVKTPRGDDPNLEGPRDTTHCGLDEELLESAFFDGARQLTKGNQNLIVICTELCAWIHDWAPFEKLLYGQHVIAAAIDPASGPLTEPQLEFHANGELNRYRPRRHTRVSAVASFRTDTYLTGPFDAQVLQVQFAVLHNYFAHSPISPRLFRSAEQFIPVKKKGRIKHVSRERSTLLLYMGETRTQDVFKCIRLSIRGLFRKVRRLCDGIKMRRIARTMKSGLSNDLSDRQTFE